MSGTVPTYLRHHPSSDDVLKYGVRKHLPSGGGRGICVMLNNKIQRRAVERGCVNQQQGGVDWGVDKGV